MKTMLMISKMIPRDISETASTQIALATESLDLNKIICKIRKCRHQDRNPQAVHVHNPVLAEAFSREIIYRVNKKPESQLTEISTKTTRK